MRRKVYVLFSLLVLAFSLVASPVFAEQEAEAASDYIVILSDGMPAGAFLKAANMEASHIYGYALNGFAAEMLPYQARGMLHNPHVLQVVPDRPVWLQAQVLPTGIDRVEADLNNVSKIDGVDERVDVDIAILDTGVDLDHPDLNVAGSAFCIETSPEDGHGHGSHVSGTAAALDNDIGVVGVAPGARIWAIKVLNSGGSGTFASVACGIDWAVSNAAIIEVISMSLGGFGSDDGNCGFTNGDVLHQAVCRAVDVGIVVVVAAGNNNQDASTFIPAAYDEVITVSAVQDLDGQPGNDFLASFSNWGADVDIAGPGVNIWSTDKNGGYRFFSGTSMATPHVAGAAAIAILLDGKPTDRAGTEALKAFLIANGTVPQNHSKGFTGDRDLFPEPMLIIENLDGEPAPPPDPVPEPPPVPDPPPEPPLPPPDETGPNVTFLTPSDGDSVTWKITVHVRAEDNESAVMLTEFYVDGKLKASVASGELVYTLQTQGLHSGAHAFTAVSYDEAGNRGEDSISVFTTKKSGGKPPGGSLIEAMLELIAPTEERGENE